MKISRQHPNRRLHNWLLYDINDRWLDAHKHLVKGRTADLGCGGSPYKPWVLENAEEYTGVDWSATTHELNADIICDLNLGVDLPSDSVDTVLCLSVLEHLREPKQFLSEVHRVLKPDGTLILQVPFMWWVHEAPHDYYRFTQHGLEYLLNEVGLADIEVNPQTGFWVMIALKLNYQSMKFVRGNSLIKRISAGILCPFWWLSQKIAPVLDAVWGSRNETAGYFVVARKPCNG